MQLRDLIGFKKTTAHKLPGPGKKTIDGNCNQIIKIKEQESELIIFIKLITKGYGVYSQHNRQAIIDNQPNIHRLRTRTIKKRNKTGFPESNPQMHTGFSSVPS